MRQVKIYIDEGAVLDLFNDEQITVTSTGKSLTDLSAGLADISQTFTVPASVNNNNIFEHYYNNDLNGTLDHNLRRSAWIEIDEVPFREGKLQLERGEVKNGIADNYTATFYGSVVTLKDLIGEDKLNVLDYSSLDHAYNSNEVLDRIDGTTLDAVAYPLITSDRVWDVTSGGGNDITTTSGSILFTELFPAIKIEKIFELIETHYGISFGGSWLFTEMFKTLHLWFKNKENYIFVSPPKQLLNVSEVAFTNGEIASNIQYTYRDPNTLTTPGNGNVFLVRHNVSVDITTVSSSPYYLDVYKNGILLTTLSSTGGNTTFDIVTNQANNFSLDELYTFAVRGTVAATFGGSLNYEITYRDTQSGGTIYLSESHTNAIISVTTQTNTNYQSLAPDMKVMDLISGIVKYANCTLTSPTPNVYHLIPLDSFYNSGNEYDITQYVDESSITYSRPPLYRNLNLKYKECKSITNRAFYDLYSREFGDLKNTFDYDGGDYTIELPFENLLQQKFTGTDLQVGYCLDKDLKNYIPNNMLLSRLPLKTGVNFRFETTNTVTSYIPFGQESLYGQDVFSSAFNLEVSSFYLTPNPNSLYETYYKNYLENLYNPKTRLVNLKSNLPLRILSDLKLNDSLLIRDKKYIIVDQKTNLVTGDVDFSLLSYWNPKDYNMNVDIYTVQTTVEVPVEIGVGSEISISAVNDSFTSLSISDESSEYGSLSLIANFLETGTDTFNEFELTITDINGNIYTGILTFTRID